MVAGDCDDFDGQLPTVTTKQQVVQAMSLTADQHQQAGFAARIVQLPIHFELMPERGELLA